MSLSPFSRDNRPLNSPPSSQLVPTKKQQNSPLTLSQALTITAGLAGLIGLLSGGVMRFSLSKSSNARFLSPLQTFPTLSNWSSSPSSDVDSPNLVGEALPQEDRTREDDIPVSWEDKTDLNWETGRDFDEFSSEGFTDSARDSDSIPEGILETPTGTAQFLEPEAGFTSDFDVPSDFDAFADRKEGRSPVNRDPYRALSEGPLLRGREQNTPADDDAFTNDESFYEETLSEERF